MKKIKVLGVTGIRSEYDILYPLMKLLRDDPRFEVKLAVSGAHLSGWHGEALQRIADDGFTIADKIDSLLMTNRKTQRVKGVGILTTALAQTVEREAPDFLYVVGDREESIATAIVGNYMDVLVAHLGGGDPVFGNADDPIRFAVSRLAHLHLVTAKPYAENLAKVGEEDFRIHFVGNPAYDSIMQVPQLSPAETAARLGMDISDGKYIVVIKHPLSSEKEDAYFQMKTALEGISLFCRKTGFKAVGIHPNTDPGSYDILQAISEAESPSIRFFKTLDRELFVNLVRNAKALAGNSSMGILEAPFYKLPVVNIGNRQQGRLNAGNVEFVSYDPDVICNALIKAATDESYREKISKFENPYGNGGTSEKIRDILLSVDLTDKKWYVKQKLC
ncbi:MAG TPA: UDP-N-acetylglucosamine 2-epimerase [Bacteroidia bacterium]|nr:UDP-N-acetylglucosamine 2-epimerase [Bacteroidia bacterium]